MKGDQLIFISRILRDGNGVEMIDDQETMKHVQDTEFNMNCLSVTLGTYIASEFNSYVVKIKPEFINKQNQ